MTWKNLRFNFDGQLNSQFYIHRLQPSLRKLLRSDLKCHEFTVKISNHKFQMKFSLEGLTSQEIPLSQNLSLFLMIFRKHNTPSLSCTLMTSPGHQKGHNSSNISIAIYITEYFENSSKCRQNRIQHFQVTLQTWKKPDSDNFL